MQWVLYMLYLIVVIVCIGIVWPPPVDGNVLQRREVGRTVTYKVQLCVCTAISKHQLVFRKGFPLWPLIAMVKKCFKSIAIVTNCKFHPQLTKSSSSFPLNSSKVTGTLHPKTFPETWLLFLKWEESVLMRLWIDWWKEHKSHDSHMAMSSDHPHPLFLPISSSKMANRDWRSFLEGGSAKWCPNLAIRFRANLHFW